MALALSCAGEAPIEQATGNDTEAARAAIEVVLTEPYCDVCSAEDKQILAKRSPVVAEVVALIDGASTSVDLAQFTFSVREIADAVRRAHGRGVRVRLAIDKGQDVEGTRARELLAEGLDVRFVAGKPSGADPGLLHAKFVVVDGAALLTGSMNFSSTGTTINEENAIVVRGEGNPRIAAFACHFEAIWSADPAAAGACSTAGVAFAPGAAPRKLIREELRRATESIDVVMHHLTFADLVKELRNAARRGVSVRVLLNATTKDEHKGAAWDELVAAGGRIRYKRVDEGQNQLMHHKLAVIDGRTLVNGSGNWSGSAFFDNYENYVVYQEPRVLGRFRALFHRLWTWSLSAESLVGGVDAATQHEAATGVFFGSLHAHFAARDGERLLDDGKPQRQNAAGELEELELGDSVKEVAANAFDYAKPHLDFMALSPHCRDDVDGDLEANMSEAGFEELRDAARASSGGELTAIAAMEWSTNSLGNHLGIMGSRTVAKVERGRFDELYREWLPERELAGDIPMVMLNHPKTFAEGTELKGSWDMIYGQNLLGIPKAGERNQKFNDFGIDDFAPLADVRKSWLDGSAMPDARVVDETMKTLWEAASPYARLMEVTLNRGDEYTSETPANPSIVEDRDMPGTFVRREKVHSDFDWFLTRGFRLAPAASHDNHYANWGTAHTSRTAIAAEGASERLLLAAIEQREVYASEDEDLALRFYVEDRVPMGGAIAWPRATIRARVHLADPDYDGAYDVRVFHGVVGADGVAAAAELEGASAGWHELTLALDGAGEHFFYVEAHETGSDRMAWSAPIWVERFVP
jgi:phosphatidylserine/phosphatidylglycerophosphate/cardiolipin synthase-like enzyme